MTILNVASPGYTTIANVLDYTTVVIPVAHVDKKIDLPDPNFIPIDKRDELNHSFCKSRVYPCTVARAPM